AGVRLPVAAFALDHEALQLRGDRVVGGRRLGAAARRHDRLPARLRGGQRRQHRRAAVVGRDAAPLPPRVLPAAVERGSRAERRGVVATYELHDRVLANRASRRCYAHEPPALDETQQSVVDRLRRDGYATLPLAELVSDQAVLSELEEAAGRFVGETEAALAQ